MRGPVVFKISLSIRFFSFNSISVRENNENAEFKSSFFWIKVFIQGEGNHSSNEKKRNKLRNVVEQNLKIGSKQRKQYKQKYREWNGAHTKTSMLFEMENEPIILWEHFARISIENSASLAQTSASWDGSGYDCD